MKPLICFYKDEKFLFSTNYQRLECPIEQRSIDFLKQIEHEYFSALKIVQVNFEFENHSWHEKQISLYPIATATVFVLSSFEFLSLEEVCEKFPEAHEELVFRSLIQPQEFFEKTNHIIEHIKQGRIYQANLTAPLKATTQQNSTSLFKKYQAQFRGDYKAFLPLAEVDLLSFSPELFLQQESGMLTTRPIKGSLSQQKNFTTDLLKNEKENAELSMIVDLLRNDLNSISDDFSAVVNHHREPMALGYIQHTHSEIQVQSRSGLSHVLEKTLPGGSISGCPKLESLKVIGEVEKYKRQAYTGTLGWWKENDFVLNITIRTMVQHKSDVYYNAGCGIVFDSNPESEWQEYLLKTGALNVEL